MIVLEMKCPQLSKPEATAARNENSIGDRMEKKPWEKPGSVVITLLKYVNPLNLLITPQQLPQE